MLFFEYVLGVMEEVFQALSKPPKELQDVDVFFDLDFRRDEIKTKSESFLTSELGFDLGSQGSDISL